MVAGILLVPTAAFAGTHSSLADARAHSAPATKMAGGSDPDTIVTFEVTSGLLTMTAPATANLGTGTGAETGLPGTTINGDLGAVTVTDDRAALNATWTVTASSTDFTTGGKTTPETIPATDIAYNPGTITTTGTVTAVAASSPPIALSNGGVPVVAATDIDGDNTAAWDATLSVTVPGNAVVGTYTGTIAQSVG
jgi:hypothetical protein